MGLLNLIITGAWNKPLPVFVDQQPGFDLDALKLAHDAIVTAASTTPIVTIAPKQAHRRQIVIDTETTGLNTAEDRIIEIALIEVADGIANPAQAFTTLVDPEGRKSHWAARKKHGISSKELIGKPTFREIAAQVVAFIGDSEIVTHNIKFDIAILNSELVRAGFGPLENSTLCTLEIARCSLPLGAFTLADVIDFYGIDANEARHRAFDDALVLATILPRLERDALTPRNRTSTSACSTATRT